MSEELLTQSRLLTELNHVISNISNAQAEIHGLITAQTEMITELNRSLSDYSRNASSLNISAQNLETQFRSMSSQTFNPSASFNMALQRNQNTSLATIQSLDSAADTINGFSDQTREMDQHLRDSQQRGTGRLDTNAQQEAIGAVEDATATIESATEDIRVETSRLSKWFQKTTIGKGLSSNLGKWSLLVTIPKLLFSVVTVVTNFVTSTIGIIADLTKTMLSLPFTIARTFMQPANELRQKIVEGIGNSLESYKDSFDLDSYIGKGAVKLSQVLIGSLKTFQDNRSKLSRLFGVDSPEAVLAAGKEMVEGLGHFGERFGRGILGNINNLIYITEAQRAMGISAQELKYYALEAATSTGSIVDTLDENLVNLNKISKQYNIDFKNTSREFHKLRLNIQDFGHLTSRELSQVSARLVQLKVSADDAAGLFQKFSSYEEAASTSAQLFQSFGMVLDAYDLVAAKDPIEIIMMLRDGMINSGKNFEMLNRHERSLLKGLTGLSDQSLSTTFSFKNLSMSQEEMRKKLKSEDPTATQLKTIKTLTSAIKQIKKVMTFNSPFDALFKGLKMNAGTQEEMIKIEVALSESYEHLNRHARNLDFNKIEKFTRPLNMFLQKFSTMVLDGRLTKLFASSLEAAGILMEAVSASFSDTPNVDTTGITNRLTAKLTSMFEEGSALFGDLYNLGTIISGTLVRGVMQGITVFAKIVAMNANEIEKSFGISFSNFGFKKGEYEKLKKDLLDAGDTFANQNSGKMWSCFTYMVAEVTKMSGFFLKVLKDVIYLGLIAARENTPYGTQWLFDTIFPEVAIKSETNKALNTGNKDVILSTVLQNYKAAGNEKYERSAGLSLTSYIAADAVGFAAGIGKAFVGDILDIKKAVTGNVGKVAIAKLIGKKALGGWKYVYHAIAGVGAAHTAAMAVDELLEYVGDQEGYKTMYYSVVSAYEELNKSKKYLDKEADKDLLAFLSGYETTLGNYPGESKKWFDDYADVTPQEAKKMYGRETHNKYIAPLIRLNNLLAAESEKRNISVDDLFVKLHDNDEIEIIASKQGGLLRNLFNNIKETYQRAISDAKVVLNSNKEKIYFNEEDEDQVILDFVDKVNIYIDKVSNRKIKVNHNNLSFR